jgi:hypothetical protein
MNAVSVTADHINAEYFAAQSSIIDSATHIIRCGQLLTQKKAEVERGQWLNWVNDNCQFQIRSANRMMREAANWTSTSNLTEESALAISRETWGNRNRATNDDIADAPPVSDPDTSDAAKNGSVAVLSTNESELDEVIPASTKRSQAELNYQHLRKAAKIFRQIEVRGANPGRGIANTFGIELEQKDIKHMIDVCHQIAMTLDSEQNTITRIKLSNGEYWSVSHEYAKELATTFPDLDVARALSDCECWFGMHPEERWGDEASLRRSIMHGMQSLANGEQVW